MLSAGRISLFLLLLLTNVFLSRAHNQGGSGTVQGKRRQTAKRGNYPVGSLVPTAASYDDPDDADATFLVKDSKGVQLMRPEYVNMPLDHSSKHTNATFRNRFWVYESSYKGQGHPIFLYDVGEADGAPFGPELLQNKSTFFRRMVEEFGGIGVVWEHRYYGKSSPVNITEKTPLEDFRYHTVAQALRDVEYFASRFSRRRFPNVDLTPASTPWVFIGASYPGNRAAWMRQFFPHIIFASYASSAPVQVNRNFGAYHDQIYRGMDAYGFGNCSKDASAAILYIDKLLEDSFTAADVKKQFLGFIGEYASNEAFAAFLDDPFESWQSFGMENGLRQFCDWIEKDHTSNTFAGSEGWAPKRGVQFVVKQWSSYPVLLDDLRRKLRLGLNRELQGSSESLSSDDISWTWQSCTEIMGTIVVNKGPMQLLSSHLRFQDPARSCPTNVSEFWVSPDEMNRRYGGWNIRPSNTFWTAGVFDPWTPFGVFSNESSAPHPKITQKIPACNAPTKQGEIFGRLMQDTRTMQHAADFHEGSEAEATRKIFTDALRQWLKCFRPRKPSSEKPFDE